MMCAELHLGQIGFCIDIPFKVKEMAYFTVGLSIHFDGIDSKKFIIENAIMKTVRRFS